MAKKMVDVDMPTKVEKTAKRSRAAVVVLASLLIFSLLASAYYLVDSLVIENSYKIYVGGSNMTKTVGKGIGLSYDKEFANGGYKDLNGKGLRLENQSNNGLGMSFGSTTIRPTNNPEQTYSVMSYLTSVASSSKNTVDTNVTDYGRAGEANTDQFVTSKFYLRNESDKINSLDLNGELDYKINIEVTKNVKNAAAALRIAVIEVIDEEKVYDPISGVYDNSYFHIDVFGQPVKLSEDTDTSSYSSEAEYVSSAVSGVFTNGNDPWGRPTYKDISKVPLVKNPNKGYEDEIWKCINFKYDSNTLKWNYDSQLDANKTYHLNYQQEKAYVVAAWFEASDPDHCDDISSGYVAFTVSFTVVENESSN